ncbi:MAG: S8 family serine peptidase [Candidatus Promineifilaceae bacterium]
MRIATVKVSDLRNPGPKRALWIVVCSVASALMLLPLFAYTSQAPEVATSVIDPIQSVMDPAIEKLLVKGEADSPIDVIIYMENKADLEELTLPEDRSERRHLVVKALQDVATYSQAPLLEQLDLLAADGAVSSYRVLWIVNAIQVTGRPSILPILSSQPGIERIVPDTPKLLLDEDNETFGLPPAGITWGLENIRAGHVWDGLGIDGSGVVVGVMDTGVDWLHPSLQENYRGFGGGSDPDHLASWFDAIDGTGAPFDPRGHGTHVAGTAVGKNGIGVAPGAHWMAVRILDANGFGTVGNIHAGFQWLLAPGGDPSLSPDVVNNSWGSQSNILDFLADVEAIKSAGIIPIFAAGNSGPGGGTIHTPAGYPDTFAVGASDDIDAVAWFSSRGPSAFSAEPKPAIVAPGTYVLSARPGEGYSYRNGTSMAAPHVAGVFALMLSANATLDEAQITSILTATARIIDLPIPSNSSGWGIVDAYAAVSGEIPVGVLAGRVHYGDEPASNITVLITTPEGSVLDFDTDEAGRYEVPLQPALYDIGINEFGFDTYEMGLVAVTANQNTILDISLIKRPEGTVSGMVTNSATGLPVPASISVIDTPISVTSNDLGQYTVSLPEGDYDIEAASIGYLLGKATAAVSSDANANLDFSLVSAPRVLLVDSGQWYYQSQAKYYFDALQELEFAHDFISIRDPFEDVPDAETLSAYDVVIWSSPTDSPAGISAGETISDYLNQGGNLLISGQNVAEHEELFVGSQSWWRHHLMAEHLGKNTPPLTVTGHESSVFSPISFTLNGPDSANNQEATDFVRVQPGAFTQPAFRYQDGSLAGLQAGDCAPFNAVYLGFGLEGVSRAEERSQIISKSLRYFSKSDREIGARISPTSVNEIAVSGHRLTGTLEIANLSETLTDTFLLTLNDSSWPITILTNTLTLGSCQLGNVTFTVDVPIDLEPDTEEEFEIVVTSSTEPSYHVQVPVRFKTPGHFLLVDDDRWYDREHVYSSALNANDFANDYWEIGTSPVARGSPPAYLLNEYDFVIWYTGYDWLLPITDSELETLVSYLDQGGRLFLSSQDYLFRHSEELLTTHYLGVQFYKESISPTLVFADDNPAFLDILTHPLKLDFGPYQNFSDGLVPSRDGRVSLWHDRGLAAGVVNAGADWKTVFWAIPFETLPEGVRGETMNRIVGWLSDLGESTFEADVRVVPQATEIEAIIAYTITLRVAGGADATGVWVTDTLPAELAIEPGSIAGGAHYNHGTHELTWQGQLDGREEHVIRYQASLDTDAPAGTLIDNTVDIFYDGHNLLFDRTAPLWIGTPDLSESRFESTPLVSDVGGVITYQLELINSAVDPGLATATIYMPGDLSLISATLTASEGMVNAAGTIITWRGIVENSHNITVTYAVLTPLSSTKLRLPTVVALTDGESGLILLNHFVELAPEVSYLPVMTKE